MTKRDPWVPLYISLALMVGVLIGVKTGQQFPFLLENGTVLRTADKSFLEVVRYINGRYVDEVSPAELTEKTIDRLLESLDPHSVFIPAADVKAVNEQLQDDFEGIGVEYLMNNDTIQIVNAIPGGPSEQLGITTGDRIVMVEDSIVAGVGINSETVVRKLRGPKGTRVKVGILRGRNLLSFEIVRDEIPNHSVDAGFMLDDKTGYIKINRFSENTYKEFMEKLELMVEKEGMRDLVIDVRGNPGGFLQKAVDILNQCFKEKDKLLLYTEGKNVKKQSYNTNGQAFYNIEKIAVLIDEASASASEIVAGALQDWDRATIVGRRTFGKGLVQEQYPLSDGSALRLTIARYYTPSGRCIQKPYKGNLNYRDDIENRRKNGELRNLNAVVDTTPVFTTANGKKVHSGGGITPDIFVPADPRYDLPFFLKLRENMAPFSISYVQKFRQKLNTGPEQYTNSALSPEIFNEFLTYCQRNGMRMDSAMLRQCETLAVILLKASLGKALFGGDIQYRVLAQHDPFIEAALKNK